MLKVGLVGAGWVTQYHLEAWRRQAGNAKVVAIADPSLERARERARAFDIAAVYADAAGLMESADIDAVDIAAPRETHAELVRMAAARGLPILCQKPLAPTFGEARALVEEVAGKVRLMVHENWRFRAYYRQIARWMTDGMTGSITQTSMTLLTSGLLADANGNLPAIERQPFMAKLDRALVMEVLIHHIDTLRFLMGELTLVHSHIGKQCMAIAGEDRAALSFANADGAIAQLLANFCVHGAPPVQSDHLVLVCERATIRLAGDTLTLHSGGAGPVELRYDLATTYVDSYAAAIGHFVAALANDTPFETSPDDNLRTLELVEQIYIHG
jgi:D-apiose dehydrogenase